LLEVELTRATGRQSNGGTDQCANHPVNDQKRRRAKPQREAYDSLSDEQGWYHQKPPYRQAAVLERLDATYNQHGEQPFSIVS
jgi:hypothetical protein